MAGTAPGHDVLARCVSVVVYVFGVGDDGSESTALPVKSTGPVGAPVGEPPAGSSDTA